MKILVTPTSFQPGKSLKALERLTAFSNDLVFNPENRPLTESELIPLLKDCDGYLAGLDQITDTVLSSCPKLKAISRYGAGYDRVNIQSAKEHNILVSTTPGANAEAVAELTFALILSLARSIPFLNSQVRNNQWPRSTGMELAEKTIGIIGLGAIGKIVARCARGFLMNVIAYDPFISEDYCREYGIRSLPFDTLVKQADIVTLHLPLNNDTHQLINQNTLQMMKPSALIVNASRGGLIDEEAAYDALLNKKLGGLALDAFELEPPSDSPLFTLDNVIVTPHTGAHTHEATQNMAGMAVDNLIAMLSGQECPYLLNK